MKEQEYERLLNIHTAEEQRKFSQSLHYHRYEPTPYSALDRLFQHYELKSSDQIVDFGCGKGRLMFYLHYFFHVSSAGVEMNEVFYHEALENRNHYFNKAKKGNEQIEFHCCLAEDYEIRPADNKFYFFNPFTIQIFRRIMKNILISFEKKQREMEIVLYYPSEDYIYYLDNQTSFELWKEVRLPDLYEHNTNERFLIYRMRI